MKRETLDNLTVLAEKRKLIVSDLIGHLIMLEAPTRVSSKIRKFVGESGM